MRINFSTVLMFLFAISLLTPSGFTYARNTTKALERNHKELLTKPQTLAKQTLRKMAKAMGGIGKIKKLSGLRLIASGQRFEPEQSFQPGGEFIHMADYRHILTQSFIKPRLRIDWSVDTHYPAIATRQYSEVINGEHAAIFGSDGFSGLQQAPMQATRMGARIKQYLASSPLALLHYAMKNPEQISYAGMAIRDNKKHHVIAFNTWQQPLHLFIDISSGLPAQLETLEEDAVYGDALWKVKYSQWKEFEEVILPTQLTHYLEGRLIHSLERDSIELLTSIDESLFEIPSSLQTPLDEDAFTWGIQSSQWFGRFSLTGIPMDLDQRGQQSIFLQEIAPGVTIIQGFTHNTLVIEMEGYLVVVDPGLYEQRTGNILKAIKQSWGDTPIKYTVATHFHNDHIGGIRGYAALGATLIIGEGTRSHYQTMLAAPHTVAPDLLSTKQLDIKFIEVGTDKPLIISDGRRKIHLIDIPNRHSVAMLMPYIEDINLAFVTDLYNPELFNPPIPALFSFWSLDLLEALQDLDLNIKTISGAHGSTVSYEDFVSDVEASF